MSDAPTFVLIGHCGPDSHLLKSAVTRAVAGARVVSADRDSDVEPHLDGKSVLLVNRVLDAGFETDDGVELIAALKARRPYLKALLVSNLPDAQARAEAAGAMRGFGKSQVFSESAASALRQAAGRP